MTHASLFSGIGGAEVAAARLGWTNLFHCEINPFGRKVLEYHFPNSISYEDITTTDFTPWQGQVDVLTGGFPCQPFSTAGRRNGDKDDRYLFPYMLRAISQIRPTWIVGENVGGIITMVQSGSITEVASGGNFFEENHTLRAEQRFTLDAICESIEQEGYSVQPIVVPACAVGAPHRRDRVWIVAHANGQRDSAPQTSGGTQSHGSDTDAQPQERSEPTGRTARLSAILPHAQFPDGNRLSWDIPGKRDGEQKRNRPLSVSSQSADCSRHEEKGTTPLTDSGKRSEGYTLNGHACASQQAGRAQQEPRRADCPQDRWRDFPTQSPVCGGDDGLPAFVDDLTISYGRWRTESIKAYGNAWVPQVAEAIFRAIEETEKLNQQAEEYDRHGKD